MITVLKEFVRWVLKHPFLVMVIALTVILIALYMFYGNEPTEKWMYEGYKWQ